MNTTSKDLYESFFKEAFKATSEKMGIVYTPNQVVDYILHATDRLLFKEFDQHLCDEGVHILDAFTGTGTFIVNLINDKELMPDDKLPYKYQHEIHCNEIMLLAYYIASINIEHAYHSRIGGDYKSFPGAVLTDTFQMYEENALIDVEMFVDNSERVLRQMETPIHVLVGNPPWSIGQGSANDNNANESYPTLDDRIEETYAQNSKSSLKKGLYDSYIRAFRWASDRIGEKGIISFVTNGGWLRSGSGDGFRKCLVDEFNSIYVFDLRGNQRTQGEQSRKEGGKIFGSGSRAPVAITLLIKNPTSDEKGVIHYHDIGDYLSREDKLAIIGASIAGERFTWDIISPDRHGDWLDQRDDGWYKFAPVGIDNKITSSKHGIFSIFSLGVSTNRDAWVYNYSSELLINNVTSLIKSLSEEQKHYAIAENARVKDVVNMDPKRISWSSKLLKVVEQQKRILFSNSCIRPAYYRPFCKQYLYYDSSINERPGQHSILFPGLASKNLMITLSGSKGLSVLMSDGIADLHYVGDTQCFPLYWYEKPESGRMIRHDAITDEALEVFQKVYPGEMTGRLIKDGGPQIRKEDIFYYIYGILHSEEYRTRFRSCIHKRLSKVCK